MTHLIVGSGRISQHFKHYLNFLGVSFLEWSRKSNTQFDVIASCATHVWLLIADDAIVPFYLEHPSLKSKIVIHCSGSLVHPAIIGCHPLMTFSETFMDFSEYQKINFISEKNRPRINELIPEMKNQTFFIAPELKPYYHALCVLAGNFSILLWEKLFQDFEKKLDLPKSVVLPYLEQITKNLSSTSATSVLTGPLARQDQRTLDANLKALHGDPYKPVYEAFVAAFNATDLDRNSSPELVSAA
jgi:predicted short-subunit dehydrogenase-like oxidoreductase (DUF2520 family)